MSRSRKIAAGAAWTYGAQLGTVIVQFAYAAITSRLVSPSGFGSYAVALAVTSLITLLANGGLAQTGARLIRVDRKVIRALFGYAMILGASGALLLAATANFWATLWGQPSAAGPIRWLSISTLLAPSLGLASGLIRRLGKFKALSLATLSANIIGMLVGAIAVASLRSTSSLLVSLILSQMIILLFCMAFSDRHLLGIGRLGAARNELGFSSQVVLNTIVSYLSGNIGKWSASVALGPLALGQWNRADVVTFVPFQQLQTAIVQAVYPEFRHDRDGSERAFRVWPDLLGLVAWVSIPLASLGAVLLPGLVPIIFGQGWKVAAALAAPLSLVGGLYVVSAILSGALEAIGRFRWIWAAQVTLLILNVIAAAFAVGFKSWVPIIAAPVLGILIQHTIHITLSGRAGFLDVRVLLHHYVQVAGASIALAIAGLLLSAFTTSNLIGVWAWVLDGLVLFVAFVLAWRFRGWLPPVRIARAYGLI